MFVFLYCMIRPSELEFKLYLNCTYTVSLLLSNMEDMSIQLCRSVFFVVYVVFLARSIGITINLQI
ncbi:hypothetical protein MIDIC_40006 [Alphaproteobacteria bacterium]